VPENDHTVDILDLRDVRHQFKDLSRGVGAEGISDDEIGPILRILTRDIIVVSEFLKTLVGFDLNIGELGVADFEIEVSVVLLKRNSPQTVGRPVNKIEVGRHQILDIRDELLGIAVGGSLFFSYGTLRRGLFSSLLRIALFSEPFVCIVAGSAGVSESDDPIAVMVYWKGRFVQYSTTLDALFGGHVFTPFCPDGRYSRAPTIE